MKSGIATMAQSNVSYSALVEKFLPDCGSSVVLKKVHKRQQDYLVAFYTQDPKFQSVITKSGARANALDGAQCIRVFFFLFQRLKKYCNY